MPEQSPIGSYEETWRRQVLAGLAVSPAERLRWLEEAFEFAVKARALPCRQFIEKHAKEVKNLDI